MKSVSQQTRSSDIELKMMPMIDVIFLLLIFFVCTANLRRVEEALPTNLSLPGSLSEIVPRDMLEEDLDEARIQIAYRSGTPSWQVEGHSVESLGRLRQLLAALATTKHDLPVIIDSDGDVPIENVIDVYDLCRSLGLIRIQFAASIEEASPNSAN
jgi:biopolymer transport protein ExbD